MSDFEDDFHPAEFKKLDPELKKKCHLLEGHSSKINCAIVTPDNKFVVTCGGSGSLGYKDCTVRLWDLQSQIQSKVFKGHKDRVISLACTSDSKYIFSGSYDYSVLVWDIEAQTLQHKFLAHNVYLKEIAVSNSGKFLVCLYRDCSYVVWDICTQTIIDQKWSYRIKYIEISFDSEHFIGVSTNCDLIIYNFFTKIEERTSIKNEVNTNIKCTKDNKFLVFGFQKNVCLVNLVTKENEFVFKGHQFTVGAVALSNNDQSIVSSSIFAVRIWNINDRSLEMFIDRIGCMLTLSNDNKYLILTQGKAIGLYNLIENKEEFIFNCHQGIITCAAITSDEQFIITASRDYSLRIWESTTMKQVAKVYAEKYNFVKTIAINKSGKYLVMGFDSSTFKVWNLTRILEKRLIEKYDTEVKKTENFLPEDMDLETFERILKMKIY